MDFINQQLGRIMLGLAILLTIGSYSMNAPRELPAVDPSSLTRSVQVTLDKNALIVASSEVYFAEGPGSKYLGPDKGLMVNEKKVKEFQPVLLELPPAGIMRGPQVVPDPGPSLEGTDKLPRYGDEFPAIVAAPQDTTPARAQGNTPAKPATPTTPPNNTPPGKNP